MRKRGVRQLALAALPIVVMGQCAPQCAPVPPPPPPGPHADDATVAAHGATSDHHAATGPVVVDDA